jgi:hypothetical protein
MVAAFTSESLAGFARNTQVYSAGNITMSGEGDVSSVAVHHRVGEGVDAIHGGALALLEIVTA